MSQKAQGKVFNDSVHGHFELPPLLIKIIDTPQFQRLRNIKQLGGSYFVFPGASHNRFEHSIGVAYLAGRFAEALKGRQPELKIKDKDILCVQIAGLCHDLGQGPFSTVYEEMFIPEVCRKEKIENEWTRRKTSVKMFDYLLEINKLKQEMMEDYKLKEKDLLFIREMIGEPLPGDEWPYKGRKENKSFLYEIVANEENHIDVDKFDYIARDCQNLGIENSFQYQRVFMFSLVCEVNGRKHICFRDKEVDNLCKMFHTRSFLHRVAYQHKATKIIEIMIRNAFIKANDHLKFVGLDGKTCNLFEAKDDMEAYTKLTDCVIDTILNSSPEASKKIKDILEKIKTHASIETRLKKEIEEALNPSCSDMDEARKILQRISTRKLYRFLGRMKFDNVEEATRSWESQMTGEQVQGGVTLTPDDFEIVGFSMDYGITDQQIHDKTFFYTKSAPHVPYNYHIDELCMRLPKRFSERFVGVYCKSTDEKVWTAAKDYDENYSQSSMATD